MNHIYRTLWSVATQSWQAVPETAKTAGKKSKSAAGGVIASVALSFSLTGGANAQAPPAINQLPTGGTVARGTATISQTATAQAATMTVNQTSQRAVVNWNTFNIGSNASVNFVQPNAQAVTLNRVSDSNPSQIFGRMTSNGQVVLTNANGIYFAPGSSVDVGAITATTHRITDDNFMSGKHVFERNGATGKIINEGNITAALAGYVALLAPEVQNAGVVVARAGTVAMAAGETITLNIDGAGSLAGISTTPSAIATLIENKQAVQAPDGQIILSAVALNKLQAGVIKNSGSLEANSLVSKGGKIYLEGDDITLTSTSKIEAKGPTGGGTVLVGGDWQGSGDLRQATKVTMEAGATIDASATDKGDGGKVVLWSDVHNADSVTKVAGRIETKGAGLGNGGEIETSGHVLRVAETVQIDTGGGQWLLDPYDVTISSASGSGTTLANTFTANANDAVVNVTALEAALNASQGTTVTIATGSSGSQLGNIIVASDITWTTGSMLTLQAAGGVTGSATITTGTANSYVLFNQVGNSTYSGIIAGAGGVRKSGAGTLELTGNNSYTGVTALLGGKLSMGSAAALGVGGAISFAGGTLQYSAASNAFDFTTGPVRTNAGSANYSIDTNGQNVTLAGNLVAMRDTGSLTKLGAGTLTLTDSNGYFGTTTISEGTLALSGSGNLGNETGYGTTVASGAVLDLQNKSSLQESITLNGGTLKASTGTSSLNASSSVILGTGGGAVDVAAGASLSIAGAVSGTTSLTKQGQGTLTLSGTSSSNTGNVDITAGTLKMGNFRALGTGTTGVVTVRSDAVLDLNGNGNLNTQVITKPLNIAGTGISAGGALINSSATSANYSGLLTLSGDSLITGGAGLITLSNPGTVNSGGFNLTLGGANGGWIHSNLDTTLNTLTKVGAGAWGLTGANTYTGDTTISAGSLRIGDSTKTTTLMAPGNVINNATLFFRPGPNTTITSSSQISGTGMVQLGGSPSGKILLQGNNTYLGGTSLFTNSGTAQAGSATAFGSGAIVVSAGSVIDLNGQTMTSIGGLTLNGTGISSSGALINSNAAGATYAGLVTLGSASTITGGTGTIALSHSGTIGGAFALTLDGATGGSIYSIIGTGAGTLIKTGNGTWTLSGANTFTGAVSVNAGALRAASNTALGTVAGGVTVASGATLELGGADSPSGITIGAEALTVSDGGAIHNVAGYNNYDGTMALSGNATITIDTGTSLNFRSTGAAITVAADKRLSLYTNGDLTFAKALAGSNANSTYLKVGSGALNIGAGSTLTEAIAVYAGLYDLTGSDYSSIYGRTPDYTVALYNAASGGTKVNLSAGTDYSGTVLWTGTTPTASSNANLYSLTYASGLTVSNTRYVLLGATSATNWTVTKAHLTVTANNASKTYGDANPTLSTTVTGFVNGDNSSSVTGAGSATTTATASSGVGQVAITAAAGSLSAANYDFTNMVDGVLTVNPLPISMAGRMNFNGTPTLDTTATGTTLRANNLIGSDTLTIGGTATLAASNPGSQAITDTSGLSISNNNYTLVGASGNVNVIDTSAINVAPLNNAEVATLIGGQLAGLTGAQMSSFSASQLQVFSPQQLSALSPSQLAGMTTLQLLSLSPAQMAAISPAKIALMTAAELGALTDAQLQALSPTQLAAIAPANFAAFTPAQIMALLITQVQNLSPEQLATFSPAQIASLNAAELAYFDARQLAAIGIFPKADSQSTFEAPIPVMTEVATANSSVAAASTPVPEQPAALSPRAVQALLFAPNAESTARTGVLAITILNSAQAKPATAGIAFEQDADTVSLRDTSAPVSVPPMSDKLVFNDKLVTFMVATPTGEMVAFEGSVVNNRMVIVAPSPAAKRVARSEMRLVLAAAVTSLGKENRVILANLEGVVLDLR